MHIWLRSNIRVSWATCSPHIVHWLRWTVQTTWCSIHVRMCMYAHYGFDVAIQPTNLTTTYHSKELLGNNTSLRYRSRTHATYKWPTHGGIRTVRCNICSETIISHMVLWSNEVNVDLPRPEHATSPTGDKVPMEQHIAYLYFRIHTRIPST